jgi:Family of unknown function (DUF6353)
MLNGLVGLAHKAKFLVNDNSTTILTSVGVAGTVTTAYLTGRATFKAARILEKEQLLVAAEETDNSNAPRVLTTFAKVKLVWRHYIPPFIAGVTTITCIIVANKIASKKIAALALSSAISERALQEYKAKVVQKLGEKQDVAIRDEIAQERVLQQPVKSGEVIIAGTGEVLFYDMTTGRYFQSTMEEVKKAVNKVNHELNNFMFTSLTSFYDEIGLPATTYSDSVGWNANQMLEIEFSTVLSSDGRPCITIDFNPVPFVEYDRLHDN